MLPKVKEAISESSHLVYDDFVYEGCSADYLSHQGTHLLQRLEPHLEWWNARLAAGTDPYVKMTEGKIVTETVAYDRLGRRFAGVNLASQDYLSLASHPKIIEAAIAAAHQTGVHSAGSAALMGLTQTTFALENELAQWLNYEDVTVFSIAWAAGYGVIKTLVKPTDYIVIDQLAHACLMEGARSATSKVFGFPHLNNEALIRRLEKIRQTDSQAGILVVTETLFSMDSDTPDIREMQSICQRYNATLLVDCAHDFGSMGVNGTGILGDMNMLGKVDVVMGSFSKSFAQNGGFVACNNPALKAAMRAHCGPMTFTNAISPLSAAIVREAIRIIRSPEGDLRRLRSHNNAVYLRKKLTQLGYQVLGNPSPIIPVIIGEAKKSRLVAKEILSNGALVNLVEYPAVPKNACRLRLQVMADHSFEQIDRFVSIFDQANQSVSS